MNKTVIIKAIGKQGSGKSLLLNLIKKFLKEKNIKFGSSEKLPHEFIVNTSALTSKAL
jgi:ABC-type lipoprotein export system ATPase subunit